MQVSRDETSDETAGEPTAVDQDAAARAAALFRLLGDPTRVRILDALERDGELCVHELAMAIGAGETKVSQALRLLRTAGLVRNRRDGRHVHYRLDDDHVATLLAVARAHVSHPRDPDDRHRRP